MERARGPGGSRGWRRVASWRKPRFTLSGRRPVHEPDRRRHGSRVAHRRRGVEPHYRSRRARVGRASHREGASPVRRVAFGNARAFGRLGRGGAAMGRMGAGRWRERHVLGRRGARPRGVRGRPTRAERLARAGAGRSVARVRRGARRRWLDGRVSRSLGVRRGAEPSFDRGAAARGCGPRPVCARNGARTDRRRGRPARGPPRSLDRTARLCGGRKRGRSNGLRRRRRQRGQRRHRQRGQRRHRQRGQRRSRKETAARREDGPLGNRVWPERRRISGAG